MDTTMLFAEDYCLRLFDEAISEAFPYEVFEQHVTWQWHLSLPEEMNTRISFRTVECAILWIGDDLESFKIIHCFSGHTVYSQQNRKKRYVQSKPNWTKEGF